jgi:hypothetical protein
VTDVDSTEAREPIRGNGASRRGIACQDAPMDIPHPQRRDPGRSRGPS